MAPPLALLRMSLLIFVGLVAGGKWSAGSPRLQQAKPWLGVSIDSSATGVLVKNAISGTPAERAGLRSGDVIIAIDGTKVTEAAQMIELIQSKGIGHTVKLEYLRGKDKKESSITLVARPDMVELAKSQLLDKPAPEFSLESAIGKTSGKLLDHRGKVVLLQFWATWCPACRSTHVELSAAATRLADKGLVILAISDEDKATIATYLEKSKATFTGLIDDKGEISMRYHVPALPTMVVIDQVGVVRHVGIGGGMYMQEALAAAEKLLASK